jgi:hypothetical protein
MVTDAGARTERAGDVAGRVAAASVALDQWPAARAPSAGVAPAAQRGEQAGARQRQTLDGARYPLNHERAVRRIADPECCASLVRLPHGHLSKARSCRARSAATGSENDAVIESDDKRLSLIAGFYLTVHRFVA